MTFTGKPSELGEVDLVGNDPEESIMEADNQVSDDLFDDHSVTDISDTNESGEMQNVTGKLSLCPKKLTKSIGNSSPLPLFWQIVLSFSDSKLSSCATLSQVVVEPGTF